MQLTKYLDLSWLRFYVRISCNKFFAGLSLLAAQNSIRIVDHHEGWLKLRYARYAPSKKAASRNGVGNEPTTAPA